MDEEQQKFDRFKPTAPKIPGVPGPDDVATPAAKKIPKSVLLGGGAMALGIVIIVVLIVAIRSEAPPLPTRTSPPAQSTALPAATIPSSPKVNAAGLPPVAPGEIASVQELSRRWSSKKFIYRRPIANEELLALVVRLPTGSSRSPSGYWAFALGRAKDPCELQFITNLQTLATEYDYRAQHPMAVDPCNHSVFDPLRLGEVGGAWVRGGVVKGSAYRPPLSILLRIEGSRISAVQIE